MAPFVLLLLFSPLLMAGVDKIASNHQQLDASSVKIGRVRDLIKHYDDGTTYTSRSWPRSN